MRRIKNALTGIILAIAFIGIVFAAYDKLNRFDLSAVYEGNGIFLTEDGNEWGFDLQREIPKGTPVTLNMYLHEGDKFRNAEIVSIEVR